MNRWRTGRAQAIAGTLAIPGDKSVSHRALMLASMADGESRIDGLLEAADVHATESIMRALGVGIERCGEGCRLVHGAGMEGLKAPGAALDCGNSGTSMRLLAGLLAGQDFASELFGDASLSRRPMDRIVEPLTAMGARIESNRGKPPLRIQPTPSLTGIDYASPVASAQIKSALLLAGLQASGTTSVTEPRPTRDYTERMLEAFGVPVTYRPGYARIEGQRRLTPCDVSVPADFSSAAFFVVAASLVPGSEILLPRVGLNPRRTGLIEALRLMGADIEIIERDRFAEPLGDIRVRHAPLQGIDLPEELVADMIDEFPVWFVAAAAARGTSRLRGAAELRVKESDRIAVMAQGLRVLGVEIEQYPDGVDIQGGSIGGGEVAARGDHRIAMSFAVAGVVAGKPIVIDGCESVATSFPGFLETARTAGLSLCDAAGSSRNCS